MKIEISEHNGQYYFDIEGIASGVSKDIHSAISEVREIIDNQTLITDFPCGITVTAQLESMGHIDDMNVYKFVDEMGRRFTYYSENEEILPVVFDRWYEIKFRPHSKGGRVIAQNLRILAYKAV